MRTKRVGRHRLVTMQAGMENRIVLWVRKAALAALTVVINVFNFFLRGLNETSDKNHSVTFWFNYSAKVNDNNLYMDNYFSGI